MGMTLDIAIGLFSIYLLLSVLCSAVSEALSGLFRLRAANLAQSIDQLLLDRALDKQVLPLILAVKAPRRGFVGQLASLLRRVFRMAKPPPESPLAVALRQHPLIKSLKHGWIGPSYIPSHTFVAALVDTLRGVDWTGAKAAAKVTAGGEAPAAPQGDGAQGAPERGPDRETNPLGELKSIIAGLPDDSELKRALRTIIDGTVKDLRDANARLERWFNDAMDRAAGRYKRRSQLLISASALLLCVGFNADTMAIASALSRDTAVRATVLATAQNLAKAPAPTPPPSGAAPDPSLESNVLAILAKGGAVHKELSLLDLQITWGELKEPAENDHPRLWASLAWLFGEPQVQWLRGLLARLLSPGVLITTAAASLGAPFWFDLLNKLVNLRAAGKSPEPNDKSSGS